MSPKITKKPETEYSPAAPAGTRTRPDNRRSGKLNSFESWKYVIAFVLIATMFVLAIASVWNDCITLDETVYISSGYSYLKTGSYRLNCDHPPLIKDLTAIPLLFLKINSPFNNPNWSDNIRSSAENFDFGRRFLFESGNDADTIGRAARVPVILLMLLLGIYVFEWTRRLFGDRTALIALFLFSLSPTVIAHGRLATNDLGVSFFTFICLYYFWLFLRKPGWGKLIVTGITFGLAQLSKFSAIVLVLLMPVLALFFGFIKDEISGFALPLVSRFKRPRTRNVLTLFASVLLIFIIGFALVWLVYHLHTMSMPIVQQRELIDLYLADMPFLRRALSKMAGIPIFRGLSHYGLGIAMQFIHAQVGHPTFFLGRVSNIGWWYYFPVVFAMKEPVPILVFTVLGFGFLALGAYRVLSRSVLRRGSVPYEPVVSVLSEYSDKIYLLSPVALFLAACMLGKINIGIRYILPAYPFMLMLFASMISDLLRGKTRYYTRRSGRPRINRRLLIAPALTALLIWYAVSSISIFPHYLAYFNCLIGGPKNAYHFVVDSNLDWGQDLKRLKKYMDSEGIDEIYLDYFGNANPSYYGIKYEKFWPGDEELKGKVACSASYLMLALPDSKWLAEKKPSRSIGYSILIFDLK